MSSSYSTKRLRAKVPPEKRKRTAQACIACRKRKRKCRQQQSGICVQCQETQTACYFETTSNAAQTNISRSMLSCTTDKWQVSPAAQRQIEDEMKRRHPGLDVSFEVIQSAAMAMEKFKLLRDSGDATTSPTGSYQHTSNDSFLDDFPNTVVHAIGKPMESLTPTGSFDEPDENREDIGELILDLPPWPTANTLIEAFFHYGESNWYYCDQVRFRKRLMSLYHHGVESDEATPGFVSLAFMAMALGSHFRHLPTPGEGYPQPGPQDTNRFLGRKYFDAAQKLHSHLMQQISIEGVQATLLMALFLLPTGLRQSTYIYMGLSLRMAMALSLHKLAADTNSLTEESRRAFWTVWCLERRFSLAWRAPDILQEGEITTTLPVYNASLDVENPRKVIRLRAFIDLTQLYSSAVRKSTPASEPEDTLKIEQRLESWNSNLPDSLRSHESGNIRATIHLQIMYHLVWMDFGRTALLWLVKKAIDRKGKHMIDWTEYQRQRRLAKLCASSAQTVLRLIESLREAGMLASFSYTDFHACSSAIVLLLLDSVLYPQLGIADKVGGSIETLDMLATNNQYAQRGVMLVKRFCKMLSKVAPELLVIEVNQQEYPSSIQHREWTSSDRSVLEQAATSQCFTDNTANYDHHSLVEHVSGTDPSLIDRQYEAADFAALEAVMSTNSELWEDDQDSQDLCFFGFSGVGPQSALT